MQFDSISEFLAMGGYGTYVWLSFGISAATMVVLLLATRWRRLSLEKEVIRAHQRRERIKAARIKETIETK